jgi:hypothetical protein
VWVKWRKNAIKRVMCVCSLKMFERGRFDRALLYVSCNLWFKCYFNTWINSCTCKALPEISVCTEEYTFLRRNILNRLREAAALCLVRPLDKGVTRMQAAPRLLLQVVLLFCNTLDLGPYLSLYISKNILIGEKWVRGEG